MEDEHEHLTPTVSSWRLLENLLVRFSQRHASSVTEPAFAQWSSIAPLGDKKNGYRLEAALCLHFRACALFGSMCANITIGGPHDLVNYWPELSLSTKQSRSMDAVRVLFNECEVKGLESYLHPTSYQSN